MAQRPEPSLITEAEPSLDDQHRARVRKYTIMMSFRIPLFLIATLVYAASHNGILAMAILAASIPLPWMAVLIANDRPPKARENANILAPRRSSKQLENDAPHQDQSILNM